MKAFSAYPAYSGMQTHLRVAVRLKIYDTHTKSYFIPSWVLLVKSQHFLNHSLVSIISDGCRDVTDNILRIRIWILSQSQNMVEATIKIKLTDEESFLLSFNYRQFNIRDALRNSKWSVC